MHADAAASAVAAASAAATATAIRIYSGSEFKTQESVFTAAAHFDDVYY